MNQQQLLSSALGLAQKLLEKNGSFIPFCAGLHKADAADAERIYTADSDDPFTYEQAYDSVLFHVKSDIASGALTAAAFCFHSRMRFSGSEDKVPAIEIEIHYKGLPAVIYYFPYTIEGSKATLGKYYTKPARESLIP